MDILWVGIGGFVGANVRYYAGREIGARIGSHLPYGTMLVNISGAFLIGIAFTILSDRIIPNPFWRQLLVIGFLGGYTTFSSYTLEAVDLMQHGRWGAALVYLLGSNLLGLLACFLGIVLARSLG